MTFRCKNRFFTPFFVIKTVIFCRDTCYFGDFLISFDSLTGRNIIGSDGLNIGEVKNAEIDTAKWQITCIIAKLSGKASENLGFKKRFKSSVVCIPVSLVTSVGDVILLGKNMSQLASSTEIYEQK
jgi:sporulation protein YlmC with PRC-barrel domain